MYKTSTSPEITADATSSTSCPKSSKMASANWREVLISPKLWHFITKIPTANIIWHSTTANAQDSNNDRQLEMAAETGNTYILKLWKIPFKNSNYKSEFKTIYSWKIALASEYNSDRQPQFSISPKPEIITYLQLWQRALKFQSHVTENKCFNPLFRRFSAETALWPGG